ncbi:MAG: NUDIX hydrolase [Parachlamydiaceae bacterium]|nr:NUDIX hydrolase [Parachlamydiaceae bacterium]
MDFTPFQKQVAGNLKALLENSILGFHGRRFDVRTLEMTSNDGQAISREIVIHPGAVVILPLLDHETVVMIRNERLATGEILWELPAGTLEPEEPPAHTAVRELIEETGYRAEEIEPMTNYYTSPGICNEAMYAYIAKGLTFVGQNLDESEKITIEAIKWPLLLEMVKNGQIRDGKTIATLLYYHTFM